MNEEERNKAYQFLQELDKNGYRYTADGREIYIIENVFRKIDKLQKELDKKDKVIDLIITDYLNLAKERMSKEEFKKWYFDLVGIKKVEEENE